jgi:hypothetical protein
VSRFSRTSIVIAIALGVATPAFSACTRIEYAELKDMSTAELLIQGDSYLFDAKIAGLTSNFHRDMAAAGSRSEGSGAAEQSAKGGSCTEEADRLAGIVRKRKDLKKTIKELYSGAEFVEKYRLGH